MPYATELHRKKPRKSCCAVRVRWPCAAEVRHKARAARCHTDPAAAGKSWDKGGELTGERSTFPYSTAVAAYRDDPGPPGGQRIAALGEPRFDNSHFTAFHCLSLPFAALHCLSLPFTASSVSLRPFRWLKGAVCRACPEERCADGEDGGLATEARPGGRRRRWQPGFGNGGEQTACWCGCFRITAARARSRGHT